MLTKEDILDLSPVQYNNYFSLGDELFIGELNYALLAYNNLNTDKKFRIWLIDAGFKLCSNSPKVYSLTEKDIIDILLMGFDIPYYEEGKSLTKYLTEKLDRVKTESLGAEKATKVGERYGTVTNSVIQAKNTPTIKKHSYYLWQYKRVPKVC